MTIYSIARFVLAGAILGICVIASAFAEQQTNEKEQCPEVVLKSPAGDIIRVPEFKGQKPILMVFWASWCTDCRDEIPLLSRINAGKFKVIAINEGESAWKTRRYVSMNKIDYPVALDPDGAVAKAFRVPGVPASVIIGKSGHIVYRGTGVPERIDSYAEK